MDHQGSPKKLLSLTKDLEGPEAALNNFRKRPYYSLVVTSLKLFLYL